ncbi:MAG TPA: class I SAM-dependent methyltransferase [Candidatus Methylomirabilis sp.]|nr:class I SAM-dependent methyltransferase [Candidatus Methylomirabilis sp.]
MPSAYHEDYAKKTDADITHRVHVKELQLRQLFMTLGTPQFLSPTVRVAVLGCADKRYVSLHERMFSSLLQKPVALTTFDITVEHLAGEKGVVQHDATLPLPGGPFDVTYSDILMRFIEPAKQIAALKESYDALVPGGLAIHLFGVEDYDPPPGYVPVPGTFRVDLNLLQFELTKMNIQFMEMPVRIETTPPGSERKIVVEDMEFVLRKPA